MSRIPINYERAGMKRPNQVKASTQQGRKSVRDLIRDALAERGPCTVTQLRDWMIDQGWRVPATGTIANHLKRVGKRVGNYRLPRYPWSNLSIWEVRE